MVDVTEVSFGNGRVVFNSRVDAVPPSSETKGNVTINNMGQSGSPAHFEVTFMISVGGKVNNLDNKNIFHWTTVVPVEDQETSYREIESQGAQQLAPMLRSVADKIEKLVSDFDQTRGKQLSDGSKE